MIRRILPVLALSAAMARAAAPWPGAWEGPKPAEEGSALLFSCPEGGCAWRFSPARPLRLDTLGAVEATLSATGAPEGASLELVALWKTAAVGFEPFVASAAPHAERIELRGAWAEGDDADFAEPPEAFELRWSGEGGRAVVSLSGWKWRGLSPDPDRIGRMGPFPGMVEAVEALKEGVRPPYTGVRGERVERARKAHAALWKAGRERSPEKDLALWKEGRRWMAQAWVLKGPTSRPAPKEERLFWAQEDRPDWIDTLVRAGATGIVQEVPFAGDADEAAAGGFPAREKAEAAGLRWIPALSPVRLPEGFPEPRLAALHDRALLQQDPNGKPLPAFSLCDANNRARLLLALGAWLDAAAPKEVVADGLENPFGDEGDYHPACAEGFAAWARERDSSLAGRKGPVPGWPASVVPDSALHDAFVAFRRAVLDTFVRELGDLFRDREIALSAAVESDPGDALARKDQDWRLWAARGWISGAMPRLFADDLGLFSARLENLGAALKAVGAERKASLLAPLRAVPLLSLWETAEWKGRQDLAALLDQIAAVRRARVGAGMAFYTVNDAWLKHDAAWTARGALRPHTP